MKAMIDFDAAPVFGIPLADGSGLRDGMLIEAPQGWGEFSPLAGCDDVATSRWLTAAVEGGTVGWPDARRGRVPIAHPVGAVDLDAVRRSVQSSGCRTAEVRVGADPASLNDDVVRVEAVRDVLGPGGSIRLSVNGFWNVEHAVRAITALVRAADDLEFVAQPCPTTAELTAVRRGIDVRLAAEVGSAAAADVVILRTGPLGGVRRSLRVAERLGLPCVVASSNETSIGLASGLALAGALPELPFACALGTVSSLSGDLVTGRSLRPVDGYLPVAPTPASPDPDLLRRFALRDRDAVARWRRRLESARNTPLG